MSLKDKIKGLENSYAWIDLKDVAEAVDKETELIIKLSIGDITLEDFWFERNELFGELK